MVCDVLFTVLAFGVFPVLLPSGRAAPPRAKGSDPAPHPAAAVSAAVALGIGVAVIAWSITGAGGPALALAPAAYAVSGAAAYPAAAGHAGHAGRAALRPRRRRVLAALTAVWGVRLRRLLPGHRRGRGRQHPACSGLTLWPTASDRLPGAGSQTAGCWSGGALLRLARPCIGALLVRRKARPAAGRRGAGPLRAVLRRRVAHQPLDLRR